MQKKNRNEWAEYLFHEGTNYKAFDYLGAFLKGNKCTFRVWAPNAKRVYVTGEFCNWEPYKYEAKKLNDNGLYECEIKGVKKFDAYKYVFLTKSGKTIFKSDPYAKHFETRPKTSSKVYNIPNYKWSDSKWLKERKIPYDRPMNIYEVHLGSWKQKENGDFYTYRELAKELVSYVKKMNYTHIEILPISEYPYDKSWGYQVTGYFAPTSRYGLPEDFMYFIDECHKNNIGVILDWVPGHFPKDEAGLYEFDGGYVYEYSSPRKMEHKEWGTRIFDYGRKEVLSFLISNASYWIEKYHIDALRVDAVSSMIYLDYNRKDGEWEANKYGKNENLEALDFLKILNRHINKEYKGAFMIAEESTAWPKVTHSIEDGGLGFNFKWNMGWMNDSLKYHSQDPFFRKGMHNNMTFSMTYAFSEKYILPLSHDEVVHGKKSILDRANVEYEKKFPSLKAFLGYMYAHPGKKLTFMGLDIAQFIEWNEEKSLDWLLLDYPNHRIHNNFIKELNKIYSTTTSLWENDTQWEGFKWNTVDDYKNNVFAFTRYDKKGNEVLIVSNFSSQELRKYKIGVSRRENYKILLNTDAKKFGGRGLINRNIYSIEEKWNGFEFHIELNIPPFSTIYLVKKS